MLTILIATSSFANNSKDPLDLLKNNGYKILLNNTGQQLKKNDLIKMAKNAKGIIAGTEKYTRKILETLLQLKVISRLGVGMDNIDLDAAKQKGLKVYKTQTTPAPAVAELALGLMLDLIRNISRQNFALKSGVWNKQMGNLLYGKTLGIIGLGTIGKTLVKLVKGFNINILAFDLYHDKEFAKKYGVKYCDLDTLLTQSDIISIHLNLSSTTDQLVNKDKLEKLKPDCIIINTSRGEVIDEEALLNALKERKILGAGLDVYNQEPYSGPLTQLDNVVLTPHIGSYAKDIRIQMEIEAAENLIRGLNEAK
jgi:D-3-phosphoglycerate dehydrogenase